MKHRLLVISPIVLAALFILLVLLLPLPPTQSSLLSNSIYAGKFLAALGSLLAALSFDRGDYLRRAWALQAISMALLLLFSLLPREGLFVNLRLLTVLLANITGVLAAWHMATAWSVAGLEPPGSPWRRRAIIAAALLLALGITGIPLAQEALTLFSSKPTSVPNLISGISDVISICLIAPVLLTVLAMRGGVLVWPWALFTASMIFWLFFDATLMAVRLDAFQGLRPQLEIAGNSVRLLACVLICSAGLAQRFALVTVRDSVIEEMAK